MLGDDVPWCSLKWSVTVTDARGPVTMRMGEALQVFAAVELDRVRSLDDVRRARSRSGAIGLWRALMDGADGLRLDDAPGEMLISDVMRRLGAVSVDWQHERPAAEVARSVSEAIASMKGAA